MGPTMITFQETRIKSFHDLHDAIEESLGKDAAERLMPAFINVVVDLAEQRHQKKCAPLEGRQAK